jgi:hypothetical protein
MTITFAVWWIPTIITFCSFFWALILVKDNGSYMSGLSNLLAIIPASFISMMVWIIYAIFK